MAPKVTPQDRLDLAKKRISSVLGKATAASMRTLEMKISDAGPYNQRIDPHVLTKARQMLQVDGDLSFRPGSTHWYYLTKTPPAEVDQKVAVLDALHSRYNRNAFRDRLGQALEIAVFRVLSTTDWNFHGRFRDLSAHDDSKLYPKDEPPNYIGTRTIEGDKLLDFIIYLNNERIGIECKNIREWIYPDSQEVFDLIYKCVKLDCVPVLVARRIHYTTSRLFNRLGMITHETFRQYIPSSEAAFAAQARDKNLLGYHDLRIGNDPDLQLSRLIMTKMPSLLDHQRSLFDANKQLLSEWVGGTASIADLRKAVGSS